jgi:hypothetical protein
MRNYGINYDAGLTADGDCTRKRFDDAVVLRRARRRLRPRPAMTAGKPPPAPLASSVPRHTM